MAKTHNTDTPLFREGGASWLREKAGNHLTAEEQALLLALVQLEKDLGRELSEEESVALEALASRMKGFDPDAIVAAVHQLVEAPADPHRKMAWPEIKQRKT